MTDLKVDPGIRVLKFWTDYVPAGDGSFKEVDKVEYCAMGAQNLSTNVASIREIKAIRPVADPDNDLAGIFAKVRHDAIIPAYDAWKTGQEVPENGTPLGAWPALSQEQVNILRGVGIRSVEEIASMGEQIRSRIRLPNVQNMVDQAKAFVGNKDKTAIASDLARKDEEIRELRAQVQEMFELLSDKTEPKRRGRPPKAQQDAEDVGEALEDEAA